MLQRTVVLAILAVASWAARVPEDGQAREWVDATGNHKVQADLVRVEGENVILTRQDGAVVKVPLDRLSQQDRTYLQSLSESEDAAVQGNEPDNRLEGESDERIVDEHPGDGGVTEEGRGEGRGSRSEDSPVDASIPSEGDAEDVIEILYRGRKIRVPVGDVMPAVIDLGDSKLRVQLARGGGVDGSPIFPPESKGEEIEPTANDPAKQPATAAEVLQASTLVVALVSVLVVAMLGLLAYFFVYEPFRRQRPLRKALRIIQKEQRPLYQKAEELFDQSLLAGLRKKNIAVARFALAYLRCLLGKYAEAATVLSDLEKSGAKIDRPTAYLMLWVQSRVKNHERVERIYSEYDEMLRGYQQSAMIASISYLALASLRLARREINGALHYFNLVRQLEVLADEIPSHLDDHEVVTGIIALFEKNREEAVKHFQAAVTTASERDKPTYAGRLGLLLCQWRSDTLPDIDDALAEVLTDMQPEQDKSEGASISTKCPHCDRVYRLKSESIGKRVQCKEANCRRRFTVEIRDAVDAPESEEASEDRLFSESDLLLRNTLLWHCVSRLVVWLRREERSGLADSERKLMRKRLETVTQLDPDLGDPYLIDGLVRYYFAVSEEDRKGGHALIEKAVELDVHVPEVLQLLDRVNKLAALGEHSLSYFHQLSSQYATNAEVDPELRDRFVRTMNRYSRFRELGAIEQLGREESVAPSLESLQGRAQILRTRVSNIVKYNLTDEESEVQELIAGRLGELDEQSRTLADETKAFQQTEVRLMESTGEFLFQDEESESGQPEPPSNDENGERKTDGRSIRP